MIIFPNLFHEVQASLEEHVRFDFDRRKKSRRGSLKKIFFLGDVSQTVHEEDRIK